VREGIRNEKEKRRKYYSYIYIYIPTITLKQAIDLIEYPISRLTNPTTEKCKEPMK